MDGLSVRKAPDRKWSFLYLAYSAPHSPLEATKEDLAEFEGIADEKRRTFRMALGKGTPS